jgi:hypothetical protein
LEKFDEALFKRRVSHNLQDLFFGITPHHDDNGSNGLLQCIQGPAEWSREFQFQASAVTNSKNSELVPASEVEIVFLKVKRRFSGKLWENLRGLFNAASARPIKKLRLPHVGEGSECGYRYDNAYHATHFQGEPLINPNW